MRSTEARGKAHSETSVAASALRSLSALNGRPRKSGANCRPTICWRPSDSVLVSFTTPDSTLA